MIAGFPINPDGKNRDRNGSLVEDGSCWYRRPPFGSSSISQGRSTGENRNSPNRRRQQRGVDSWRVVAVGGGGHQSGHKEFGRGAAPEKIKKVLFGKLWVNSLKAATAGELARVGWLECIF